MRKREAEIDLGSDHIIIERRYRALGALNDLLIAVWFLIGSIFFFYDSLMTGGTWLFLAGSIHLFSVINVVFKGTRCQKQALQTLQRV